jgi:methylthioribose-1-phosphate isomerase
LQAEIFAIDRSVAEHAAALLPVRGNVLTAGGTGAQSTGGYGTASGALVTAHRAGRTLSVYVAESRPALTGARITAAELRAEGVPLTLIPDAAVAATISAARIDAIIVGAEAIAANGDTIAELGTLALALAAAHHRIPLFVAAPRAAVDPTKRRAENLAAANRTVEYGGSEAFAAGCDPGDSLCAPAARYDVTPGNMIAAIVTEFGISRPPYIESLAALANRPNFAMVGPRTIT